ncbi:cell division cycle-associated 7-like protein isoform X2 [Frieseomelitta varia]|uniref:cell division cycle-associated 7-like protein isoform X2 n=1 Tax=Frieseomelitta varia TaxID=561572 RepID=UPI001CB6803E|nr:cell division cycle-associated 7-like protein isoform X2 [Frieseomelitta varia]
MSENDYDDLRKRNIAEKNAIFAEIFNDLEKKTNEIKELEEKYNDAKDAKKSTSTKSRKIRSINKFKIKRSELDSCKRYNTRSRSRNVYEDKGEEKENNLTKSEKECDADEEQYNDNLSETKVKIKKRIYNMNKVTYNSNNIPSVDEITDEMLANVATKFSLKEYCSINGSTCHQCRQKTLDTKTVCRSGECIGLKGQFCGVCLKGRYGEDIVTALKDPDWACPPCRGLCNCSICRTKSGLSPTGKLVPVAKEEGYCSVMDYLQFADTDDT